jgi:DNA-binding response OmpR family regulator
MIAIDIANELEGRGARVAIAHSLRDAVEIVEADGPSIAILDHRLADGDCFPLCERLRERSIPFLVHTGYTTLDERVWRDTPVIPKPASIEVLLATAEALLKRQSSNANSSS